MILPLFTYSSGVKEILLTCCWWKKFIEIPEKQQQGMQKNIYIIYIHTLEWFNSWPCQATMVFSMFFFFGLSFVWTIWIWLPWRPCHLTLIPCQGMPQNAITSDLSKPIRCIKQLKMGTGKWWTSWWPLALIPSRKTALASSLTVEMFLKLQSGVC